MQPPRGEHNRGYSESNSAHDRLYGAQLRVYEAVKARITAHEPPLEGRIQTAPLAEQLFVSATPIREALIRLAAERVILIVPKAGFFVKEFSASEIAGLYRLQKFLLDLALGDIRHDGREKKILRPPELARQLGAELERAKEPSASLVLRVINELTHHIARQSVEAEIMHIIDNINDRTCYTRMKDHEAFGVQKKELLCLCQAYYRLDLDRVSAGLHGYFRGRTRRLPEVLRQLEGASPGTSFR